MRPEKTQAKGEKFQKPEQNPRRKPGVKPANCNNLSSQRHEVCSARFRLRASTHQIEHPLGPGDLLSAFQRETLFERPLEALLRVFVKNIDPRSQ